jgi:exopolysaccharide production protein ExoQ
MNPQLAVVVYAIAILALFALCRDSQAKTSKAIWIAVVWLLIGGSRNVSAWLSLSAPAAESEKYVEGNAVDQVILGGLVVLGVIVLVRRRVQLWSVIQSNAAIILYFLLCGLSVLWSDYPSVSSRRWVKSLGDLVMVLVVLTDADRLLAIKRFLSRAGFLLVPISVLLINYYPNLGRAYARAGDAFWTGVGTDKNALGLICLIFGLPVVWYLLDPQARSGTRRTVPVLTHAAFLGVVMWLLLKSLSATSLSCLLLGSAVMAVVSRPTLARRPAIVHLVTAGLLTVSVGALFASSLNLLGYVGRDPTLTGRTVIWRLALAMDTSPLLGAGYESFWIGERLESLQRNYPGMVLNQAHNGYIETYLNLGWLGVAVLTLVIVTGYRRTTAAVLQRQPAAALGLAYFVSTCIYNCTEASFKMMHPVWITFLLATTVTPEPAAVAAVGSEPRHALDEGERRLARFKPALARTTIVNGERYD